MTTEDIINCYKIHKELNKLCPLYFEKHKSGDYEDYSRWTINENGQIRIHYNYYDHWEEFCGDYITTTIEEINNEITSYDTNS